jgi:imidazolonepropionase-like amidohydrolase
MGYARPPVAEWGEKQTRSYRAITRHSDGRIIHVRDIEAASDAEAIRIVTARGSDIRTDLWNDSGLVMRLPDHS